MSVEFTVAWDGAPGEWWGVAKFTLANNTSAVLEDPLVEFTVQSRQEVSANSGLAVQRAEGSNLVRGRIEDWVPNKIAAGQTVHFTVGLSPADGQAGVGFLPSNLKINGQGGGDHRPGKPGRLRVEAATSSSVTLAWDESSSPVGIDHYELSWSRQGGEPSQTRVAGTGHTVADLRADTDYRFAVYGVDVQGRGGEIATAGGRTKPGGPIPEPGGDYPASAPFVSATAWPTPRLRKIHRESEVAGFFLGFIAPREIEGRWRATWAALEKVYDKYERSEDEDCSSPNYGTTHTSTTADSGYLKWLITPLQEQGVKFALSVGGANAHPLEEYTTVEEAVREYIDSLDNYDTVFLDFDIEGSALATDELRDKHVLVLNEIRRQRPDIKISHTLAVDRDGWNHSTIRLMDKVAASGFKPDLVMGMLMEMRGSEDYLAITKMSAEAMVAQMREKFGWSETEAWHRFGACPMYGENYNKRVFLPADMRCLVEWARGKGIAVMSGWDATRDYNQANPQRTCEETPDCSGAAGGLDGCTKVHQEHLEFCKATAGYTGPGTLSTPHTDIGTPVSAVASVDVGPEEDPAVLRVPVEGIVEGIVGCCTVNVTVGRCDADPDTGPVGSDRCRSEP